jgi:hypothetical protein
LYKGLIKKLINELDSNLIESYTLK